MNDAYSQQPQPHLQPAPDPGAQPYPHPSAPPQPGLPPQVYAYPVYVPYGPAAPRPANGLGIAALSLSIPCAAVSWIPPIAFLAWVGGVVAIVLGAVGLARVKRGTATNRGSALTGVILGAFAVAVGVLIMTWLLT